jgi:hypothetical protein
MSTMPGANHHPAMKLLTTVPPPAPPGQASTGRERSRGLQAGRNCARSTADP